MKEELKLLEEKINQFVQLCHHQRTENIQLREQLAEATSENKNLSEEVSGATNRLDIENTKLREQLAEATSENKNLSEEKQPNIPKCGDIYISTKTMICYLNQSIDLTGVFWNIPIIDYSEQKNGVVKKQIKINCTTEKEVEILENIVNVEKRKHKILDVHILKQIKSKRGLIKDNRKINIGLSKKDLIFKKKKKKWSLLQLFCLYFKNFS